MSTNHSSQKNLRIALLCLIPLCVLAFFAGSWSRPSSSQDDNPAAAKAERAKAENRMIRGVARKSPEEALLKASAEGTDISHATMAAIVAQWLEEDPRAPLNFLTDYPECRPQIREQLFLVLLPIIVRESPDAGMELAQGLEHPWNRQHDLIAEWALVQPLDAMDYSFGIHRKALRQSLAEKAFEHWLQKDPDQAIGWLLQIDDPNMQRHLYSRTNWYRVRASFMIRLYMEGDFPEEVAPELMKRLVSYNVNQAIELLNARPVSHKMVNALYKVQIKDRQTFESILNVLPEEHREYAIIRLIPSWIKEDPEGSRSWIDSQKGSPLSQRLATLYARESMVEPSNIDQLLSSAKNPSQVATSLLYRMIPRVHDPIQWARENLDVELRGQAFLNAFKAIERYHPDQMIDVLREIPEGGKKDSIFKKHMDVMMLHAPEATMQMILDQAPSKLRKEQSTRALQDWIWTDPDAAQDYILQADWIDDALYGQLQLTLAQQLSKSDPSAAIRLLEQLPENISKNHPLVEFLEGLAIRGEGQLVRNAISRLPKGPLRQDAMLRLVNELAEIDPRDTYRWIQHEQDEAFRGEAFEQLARVWTRSDPDAAAQWVNALAPGKARDHASEVMIDHEIAQGDFRSALNWARSIQDEEARQRELKQTIQAWAQLNPSDPRRTSNASNRLSEAEKERLLKQIK